MALFFDIGWAGIFLYDVGRPSLFIIVPLSVILEAFVFRYMLWPKMEGGLKRSFKASLLVNLVSGILGVWFTFAYTKITVLAINYVSGPDHALEWFLLVALVLSILVEGLILMTMAHKVEQRFPVVRCWLAIIVANLGSYLLSYLVVQIVL